MKKFCYVFKSSDPAFLGWEWELTDLMHDWLKPRFHATKPGPDPVVNVINPKPEGWPAHEKRFNWDYARLTIEDLSVIIYTMDAYDLRRDVLPHDVAQEVLQCLGRIYQEQVDQREKLEAVIQKLRDLVQGIDLPSAATSLLSTYCLGSPSGTKAAQAVNALALETMSIQREVDRLSSVPMLTEAVTGALASLKGLGFDAPDSPAYKAMVSAERAASVPMLTGAVTGALASLKGLGFDAPDSPAYKAMVSAERAASAISEVAAFNPSVKAMVDANPGLKDLITKGAPAFDAGKIDHFNQCPHCGREI